MKSSYLLTVGGLLWAANIAASSACRPTPPASSSLSFSEPPVPSSSASGPSPSTLPCGNQEVDPDFSTGLVHWQAQGDVTFLGNCSPYNACAQLALSGTGFENDEVSQVGPNTVAGQRYHFSVRYRVVQNDGGSTSQLACSVEGQSFVQLVNVTEQPVNAWATLGFDYVATGSSASVACRFYQLGTSDLAIAVQLAEVALVPATCGAASASVSAVAPTPSEYVGPCDDVVVDGAMSDWQIWGINESGDGAVTFTDDCGEYGNCAELAVGGGLPDSYASASTGATPLDPAVPYTVSLRYRVLENGGQHAKFGVALTADGFDATHDISGDPLDTWLTATFPFQPTDPGPGDVTIYLRDAIAPDGPTAVEVTNVAVAPESCVSGLPVPA